jgi:hypothetical protein
MEKNGDLDLWIDLRFKKKGCGSKDSSIQEELQSDKIIQQKPFFIFKEKRLLTTLSPDFRHVVSQTLSVPKHSISPGALAVVSRSSWSHAVSTLHLVVESDVGHLLHLYRHHHLICAQRLRPSAPRSSPLL